MKISANKKTKAVKKPRRNLFGYVCLVLLTIKTSFSPSGRMPTQTPVVGQTPCMFCATLLSLAILTMLLDYEAILPSTAERLQEAPLPFINTGEWVEIED
jgi:hypothetical protein